MAVLSEVVVDIVAAADEGRFRDLMEARHYLGAVPGIDETVRYVAHHRGRWLALVVFSAVHAPTRRIYILSPLLLRMCLPRLRSSFLAFSRSSLSFSGSSRTWANPFRLSLGSRGLAGGLSSL